MPPVDFALDPKSGETVGIDDQSLQTVFGIEPLPLEDERGYHTAAPTTDGMRWGLESPLVVNGGVSPRNVTTTLACNEFGAAVCWYKVIGKGFLLQLAVPTNRLPDLTESLWTIEYAEWEHGRRRYFVVGERPLQPATAVYWPGRIMLPTDLPSGSSSVAERQLPKLNVAGSIPVSRSTSAQHCEQSR